MPPSPTPRMAPGIQAIQRRSSKTTTSRRRGVSLRGTACKESPDHGPCPAGGLPSLALRDRSGKQGCLPEGLFPASLGRVNQEDTIAAIATPPGSGAIGVIRLSGPGTTAILTGLLGSAPEPRRSRLLTYRDIAGRVIDEVLALYFASGASYTGEASAELSPHGNPLIINKILEDLLRRGARLAEPGEFTRRAFLNGRMDLSQAEAVAELIAARSDQALAAARQQLTGSTGRRVAELAERTTAVLAELEAYIDFPEEDLPPEDRLGPRQRLIGLEEELGRLEATRRTHGLIHEGTRVALVGSANAGKSTLFNALLSDERAMVSEVAGTTRDYLEAECRVGPHWIRLIDTAGLGEAAGLLEAEGQRRSQQQTELAHVLLLVVDSSTPRPTLPDAILSALPGRRVLLVEAKADLPAVADTSYLAELPRLPVSIHQSATIRALEGWIESAVAQEVSTGSEEDVLVNARHAEAVQNARESVALSRQVLEDGASGAELASVHLREALDTLGGIVGKIDNEAVLDRLFASFCIGK